MTSQPASDAVGPNRASGRSQAITRLPSHRPDLLIFTVNGKIARADVEAMAHGVESAMDTHGMIDILLIFEEFDGLTLGAVFDGDAAHAGLRSNAHVRRYAVVGAPAIAAGAIRLIDPVTPVDACTFDGDQVSKARAWIDRPDEPTPSQN